MAVWLTGPYLTGAPSHCPRVRNHRSSEKCGGPASGPMAARRSNARSGRSPVARNRSTIGGQSSGSGTAGGLTW